MSAAVQFEPLPSAKQPSGAALGAPACDPKPPVCWNLKRNCSLPPAVVWGLYASLAVLSLGIATFFWWHGATLVMPFAWLEIVAVGAALLVYGQHAGDGERVTLEAGRVVVERRRGEIADRLEFDSSWARVDAARPAGAVALRFGRQVIHLGRHVTPLQRQQFARELTRALAAERRSGAGRPPDTES